jgi:radical SAM superfamily enzyme YgiQ (UPF0313 family)
LSINCPFKKWLKDFTSECAEGTLLDNFDYQGQGERTQMRKKLLLIQPVAKSLRGKTDNAFLAEPLALQIIAGLTPNDWEITIIDERMEDRLNIFDIEEADLVGITSYTCTAPRAYEIADSYRKRGTPVVMGGIHASILPEEALKYVDTVVTGEAESIWGKVIADFEANDMQRIYNGGLSDLNRMPKLRRDVLPSHYQPYYSIQTGRGCPHDCEFCSVTIFNGFQRRKFPLEEVLKEFKAIPHKVVLIADDNLVGHSKKDIDYAIGLFQGIIESGMNKMWTAQTSLNIAQDKVLRYASKSGCKIVSIGIEAEDTHALQEMNKTLNLNVLGKTKYDDIFALIHQYGIIVDGSFIYGLDTDTPEKLWRRTDFIINSDLDVARTSSITPLPGTRLFNRMKDEGRILYTNFPEDWELYDLEHVVIKPASMKPEELSEIFQETKRLIYSDKVLENKCQKILKATDEFTAYLLKSQYLGYQRHYHIA